MQNELVQNIAVSGVVIAYLTERVYDRFIKTKAFVRTVDLPEIIKEYKIITADVCLKNQEDFKEKQDHNLSTTLNAFGEKLDIICKQNKAMVKFLAKRCKDSSDFEELIDVTGD